MDLMEVHVQESRLLESRNPYYIMALRLALEEQHTPRTQSCSFVLFLMDFLASQSSSFAKAVMLKEAAVMSA